MNLDLTVAREAAESAATAAQELIGDYLASGQWGVTHKGDNSPVTEVDVASEHAIKAVLLHACPEAAFYGEETGHSSGDAQTAPDEPASQAGRPYRWLVDPIDGTKSFIRGMPFYSTQIALEVGGELKLGVSNAPAYGERLVAVQGEGVWLNVERCSAVTSPGWRRLTFLQATLPLWHQILRNGGVMPRSWPRPDGCVATGISVTTINCVVARLI